MADINATALRREQKNENLYHFQFLGELNPGIKRGSRTVIVRKFTDDMNTISLTSMKVHKSITDLLKLFDNVFQPRECRGQAKSNKQSKLLKSFKSKRQAKRKQRADSWKNIQAKHK